MATYDLHCRSCGCDFDIFVQGFLKDGQKVCPECSSKDVEQRFTGGFMTGSSGSGKGAPPSHSCSSQSFG